MAEKFLAFSGGVESSAMCVMFGADAQPVFTDTGWEHQPMYERIRFMDQWLTKFHGPCFKGVRWLQAQNVDGTGVNTLPDYIKLRKYFPWVMARFCTRLFKIVPMNDFLTLHTPCELMIGLNYDERDEREGNLSQLEGVTFTYPLIDAKITRADCEQLLAGQGIAPNFPPFMRRGGCMGCFYKSRDEYEAMALMAPRELELLADLEEAIQDQRTQYFSVVREIGPLRDFLRHVQSQGSLFENSEMYRGETRQTACGVFCHR